VNEGSLGHPYFCSRPCVFFTTGACANADRCTYCHMAHQKRPMHLDKRNRSLFEGMETSMRVGLLMSLIRQKLLDLDLLNDMEESVEELAEACGVTDRAAEKLAARKSDARLRSALASMALRPLLTMLERIVGAKSPAAADAAHALMTRCRAMFDARSMGLDAGTA